MAHTLAESDLHKFSGTEHWYRHSLVRSVLFTDGVKHVAEAGGAHWLVDEIALAQRYEKKLSGEEFQLWKLTVTTDNKAILVCEDGNSRVIFSKSIPFTDFPLDEISFYFVNNTILLPSEY